MSVLGAQSTRTPQELLQEAQALHRAGKLDEAIKDYRLFLAQYPDVFQVRSDLGAALAGAGRYEEAIVEYKRALQLQPLPQIRLNLALAYYKSNRPDLAVEDLQKVREALPDDLRVTMLLADCYLRLGENKKVIELLDPLERTHADDLAIVYMLGSALVRDGQVDKGQVIIDKILKNGDSAQARLLMGTMKLMIYDAPGAQEDLQKAIELDPRLPSAHAYLGQALRQNSDVEGAKKAYRAELSLNPNDFDSNLYLGVILKEEQKYEEALPYFKHALEVRPGDMGARYQIASLHLAARNYPEAQRDLDALVKEAPNFTEAHIALARLYYLLKRKEDGDREQAIAAKLTAEQQARDAGKPAQGEGRPRQDDSAEAGFLRGKQFFESGNYPAAVKELGSAAELHPKLPQLQSYYGRALLNTGDPVAAAAAFRRELAENPNDYPSNLALGQILINSKQYAEALPLIEAALRLQPDSTEARLAWGECLSSTGKLPEARKQLEAVTRAAPASLEAHRELLSVYTRLHLDPEAARERARVGRLEREAAAKEGGPQLGALAPDFDLPEIGTKQQIRLSAFRGKAPVVLVFGSYSCPNFRASAEALNTLFQHYGRAAHFFLVYIREAHARDDWQSTRNEREGITVSPALTFDEKADHARMCTRNLHLKFPALVDSLEGKVEAAYAAWPSRAFVIGPDGRIRYSTRLTQQDFDAAAMEKALRAAMARP